MKPPWAVELAIFAMIRSSRCSGETVPGTSGSARKPSSVISLTKALGVHRGATAGQGPARRRQRRVRYAACRQPAGGRSRPRCRPATAARPGSPPGPRTPPPGASARLSAGAGAAGAHRNYRTTSSRLPRVSSGLGPEPSGRVPGFPGAVGKPCATRLLAASHGPAGRLVLRRAGREGGWMGGQSSSRAWATIAAKLSPRAAISARCRSAALRTPPFRVGMSRVAQALSARVQR